MTLRAAFQMDHIAGLHIAGDSTFALMLEAASRGHALLHYTPDRLTLRDGRVVAHAETVALREAGKATGRPTFPGATLYTTFEPCPMCCGALFNAEIATVVMGGRPSASETRWSGYTLERLIEMAGWGDRLKVVTGVLTQECVDIR